MEAQISEKITANSIDEIASDVPESSAESSASDYGDLHLIQFDESDVKRISKEIENQHIFPLTSTLTQVYQHDIESTLRPLLNSSIKAHSRQLELICHRGYEPLFNSLSQVTRTTDKVHNLAKTSKIINKDLRELVVHQRDATRPINLIAKQRKNLNDTVGSLETLMPILTEFSRVVDYKNGQKQYFALKTILKIEAKIDSLPENLKNIDFVNTVQQKLPEFKNELKISCREEIKDWLEKVNELTKNVRTLEEAKDFADYGGDDDQSFVPLYRAKNVYETLEGLDEFSGDFKKKRNDQRKFIVTLPNEALENGEVHENGENRKNGEKGEKENGEHSEYSDTPIDTVNISEIEAYLARIASFFSIERTISQTVPIFCNQRTLESHYRETINFGLLLNLELAMMNISEVSKFQALFLHICNFLHLEKDHLPDELMFGIEKIKEDIQEKCEKKILDKVKMGMIDILLKDSYAPVRNGKAENNKDGEIGKTGVQDEHNGHFQNGVSDHDVSTISEISIKSDTTIRSDATIKSDSTITGQDITTNSEEFKKFLRILREAKRNFPSDTIKIPSRSSIGFSEMVPRICFKLVECLELIKNQPSQPVTLKFDYFTNASILAFKKCLENALEHNKYEEKLQQIRPMKQLYVNMSYLSVYAPIILKQEFFDVHFNLEANYLTDLLPVKAWKDSVSKVEFEAGMKIDEWFDNKLGELFEMEVSDRNVRTFIDINMNEIEVHCDSRCKEQRYNAVSQSLARKTMEELVGEDGDVFEDFVSEEDLENCLLEINKIKIWLDTKQASFSEQAKMSEYRFSEYLDKPKQLIELCLNDKWFDFITNYGKNLKNQSQVTKKMAIIMYKRTLQHEIKELGSGFGRVRLGQEDKEKMERWRMIGEKLKNL